MNTGHSLCISPVLCLTCAFTSRATFGTSVSVSRKMAPQSGRLEFRSSRLVFSELRDAMSPHGMYVM